MERRLKMPGNILPTRTDVESSIVTNLVLAGLLKPAEISRYMTCLGRYSTLEILSQLVESNKLRHQRLEDMAYERRN